MAGYLDALHIMLLETLILYSIAGSSTCSNMQIYLIM